MGRYLGQRVKIDRKFHSNIFGFNKALQNRPNIVKKYKKKPKRSEYSFLLASKKKVLYVYNLRERQLSRYVDIATKKKENTEEVLAKILESRLDNIVYRFGFFKTRRACRQAVSHKHITVNNRIVNIASYLVKEGDIITLSNKAKKNENISSKCNFVNVYGWLKWNDEKKQGEVLDLKNIKDIPEKLNFKNVIEFYSR